MSVAPTSQPASQTPSATGAIARLRLAAGDIKLSHSVFALPFAVLAAALARHAAEPWSTSAAKLGLVVFCMVAARTWAMLINRVADAEFDAQNPRTAGRAVASGQLPLKQAWALAAASGALFIAGCACFYFAFGNHWPVSFSIPVLGWLALYSYAKRYTAACHLLLGSALAISPVAACLAVNPVHAGHPTILLLSGFVALWVAGFDVLYALQDEGFDRATGLHSIPAWLGKSRAVWVSRAMHLGALVSLIAAWQNEERLGLIFGAAVAVAGCLLCLEHIVLIRRGLAGLPLAFFTLNGCVSLLLGAAGVIDAHV